MRNILFFVSNLNGGGAQRTVVNIINNIDREKFNIKLVLLKFNPSQSYATLISEDIEIININKRGRYSIPSIIKIMQENQPDIIFSTLSETNIAVSVAHKLIKSKAKLVLRETCHKTKKSMGILKFNLLKFAYKNCDIAVGLSKGVSNELSELYNIPGEKISTIYNPVNIDAINMILSNDNKIVLDDSVINFVACGRLVEQKNFSLLINALGNINKDHKNWVLHLLGDGNQKGELLKLTTDLGIRNKVIFHGFQSNPYKYMKSADLFVLSSKKEGFGHVIVEAMACGIPVLSTNCPHGPAEIINNERYGWLTNNNDLEDMTSQLRIIFAQGKERLSEKEKFVKDRARDFEAKKIVKQYEMLFDSI